MEGEEGREAQDEKKKRLWRGGPNNVNYLNFYEKFLEI